MISELFGEQRFGGAVDAQERTDFITSYTKLLLATWSDESLGDRLVDNPKEVLAQFGLNVPASAHITLVREIPAEHADPDVDVQVRLWQKGLESGEFEMHVPQTPQIDMEELSDAELEGVTGGLAATRSVATACGGSSCATFCCCTPCCSCA
jgi:hypothetical protein